MEQAPKAKIGPLTAGMMLFVAAFFDALQFFVSLLGLIPVGFTQILVLVITTPITIVAYIAYIVWFAFLGAEFFSIKKPMRFFARAGGMLVEAVPYLSGFPILTANVLFSIVEANGPNAFPANMLPSFLLNFTPAGKVAKKVIKTTPKIKK